MEVASSSEGMDDIIELLDPHMPEACSTCYMSRLILFLPRQLLKTVSLDACPQFLPTLLLGPEKLNRYFPSSFAAKDVM